MKTYFTGLALLAALMFSATGCEQNVVDDDPNVPNTRVETDEDVDIHTTTPPTTTPPIDTTPGDAGDDVDVNLDSDAGFDADAGLDADAGVDTTTDPNTTDPNTTNP